MTQPMLRANARTLPIALLTADPALRRAFALFGPDAGHTPALADRAPRPRLDGDVVRPVRVLELA
jgi:hypothetical protein